MKILLNYGAFGVFLVMFLEQLGLPLPAVPVLLATGALIVTGALSGVNVVSLAIVGALLGDWIWYEIGRERGAKVLSLLCRISMEPDTCVRRTENIFVRYGVRTLLVSKFIPGFNRLAPPMAGLFSIKRWRFFLFDGIGNLIYAGAFLGAGALFHNQIELVLLHLAQLGRWALAIVVGLFAVYILGKWIQRRWVLHQLRMARITPEELHAKVEAKEAVTIIDLRSMLDMKAQPYLIPGALHIPAEEFNRRHPEIPRDREVVVYCSCPNEVTAARVAIRLRRQGITQIRPLLGGIGAWRYLNYDLDAFPRVVAAIN